MERNNYKNKKKYLIIKTKPRNYIKANLNCILNILLIVNSFFPISNNSYILIPLSFISEITIKIKGNGPQPIINTEHLGRPNKISLKGKPINSTYNDNYEYINITDGNEYTIQMTWDHVTKVFKAFEGLSNITEIDLSNLNAGNNITEMADTFKDCTSLKSVNLLNLDTSKVTNMGHLFSNCISLTSLDLSGFITSNVNYMDHMFDNCTLLTSLKLSNFNTEKVINITNMFRNCHSLTSLNLSNFHIAGNDNISSMFIGCEKLEYLNLNNTTILENPKHLVIQNIIRNTTKNIVICINIEGQNETYEQLEDEDKDCVSFDCSENWILKKKKIFASNDSCVDDCLFSYENKCYDECPNGTVYNKITCVKNLTRIICEPREFFLGHCKNIFRNLEEKETFKKNILSAVKNGSLSDLISSQVYNGSYMIIDDDKEIYLISTLTNQKDLENMTSINFSECEKRLRNDTDDKEIYVISNITNQIDLENVTSFNFSESEKILRNNIDDNELYLMSPSTNQIDYENGTSINSGDANILKNDSYENEELYIFRIDHIMEGYNIPIIEYVIFSEKGVFLNLEKCNNIYSQYFIPISINEDNLYKHDPSSDYYNDECNKFTSEDGTDVTIYDRKNDYNENHLSLCEANCIFKGYNSSISIAECECKTRSNLYSIDDFIKNDFSAKIENEQKLTNLNLIKCYNLLKSSKDLKTNSGFISLALIIMLFIIVMIIFCAKGYNNLKNKIDKVISIKFKPVKTVKRNNTRTLFDRVNTTRNIRKNAPIKRDNPVNKLNILKNSKRPNYNINNKNKTNNKGSKTFNKQLTTNNTQNNQEVKNFLKTTNDYELNNLPYSLALKYDKREFCEYYFSLIRTKQLIFFSFCNFDDYNSGVVKKFIFFLSFALHYTINALFFTDKVMHQIYQDGGKYNIIFQLPFITYSAIISTVILRIMLITLVLTEKSVIEIKNQKSKLSAENKKKKALKCVIIKFAIFFAINLILLVIFWFYLACFNALYANTQIALIINTAISLAMSCIYPFIINIIPAFFRTDILKNKPNKKIKISISDKKDSEYAYKISQWLQLL